MLISRVTRHHLPDLWGQDGITRLIWLLGNFLSKSNTLGPPAAFRETTCIVVFLRKLGLLTLPGGRAGGGWPPRSTGTGICRGLTWIVSQVQPPSSCIPLRTAAAVPRVCHASKKSLPRGRRSEKRERNYIQRLKFRRPGLLGESTRKNARNCDLSIYRRK
jgi:hypothetical protein